jgi:hypothetical protein
MKPHAFFSKVLVASAFTLMLSASLPKVSLAGTGKDKSITSLTEDQVTVQYCGSDNDSYLFRVEFKNPRTEKFTLIVKNDDGLTVFQEQYDNSHFVRTFKLPKEDADIHPTFIVRTANSEVKRSFVVSRKITEDLVVTKL